MTPRALTHRREWTDGTVSLRAHSATAVTVLCAAVALLLAETMAPASAATSQAQRTPATAAVVPAAPVQLLSAVQLRALLAAQRGKVVVLNLWATWCLPCLREIPVLLQLTGDLAPRGVTLIGVAMDEPQALHSQVEPFHRKYFPAYRTWLRNESDMDNIASVVDPAWNEILPTTYVIGRDGALRTKIQGARTAAQFRASFEAALQ